MSTPPTLLMGYRTFFYIFYHTMAVSIAERVRHPSGECLFRYCPRRSNVILVNAGDAVSVRFDRSVSGYKIS